MGRQTATGHDDGRGSRSLDYGSFYPRVFPDSSVHLPPCHPSQETQKGYGIASALDTPPPPLHPITPSPGGSFGSALSPWGWSWAIVVRLATLVRPPSLISQGWRISTFFSSLSPTHLNAFYILPSQKSGAFVALTMSIQTNKVTYLHKSPLSLQCRRTHEIDSWRR